MADTLVDAGPLIALISRTDTYHHECARTFRILNCPFITTLAVLTEAMYFLQVYGGATGQEALWKLVLRGDLVIENPAMTDLVRMDELMRQYSDLPMDF